jgi:NAD-dependent deacetylase
MNEVDAEEREAAGMTTARRLLHEATGVVVLTGAGISTDSGIPDFRGPNGVWTRNPAAERMATIDAYINDPDVRREAWRSRVDSPMWNARPNRGHRALVDLERQGRLHTLVTQNIDGLHQAAGNDPAKIVEIHGTIRDVVCLACGDRNPAGPTLQRVRDGEDDPRCLRPAPGGAIRAVVPDGPMADATAGAKVCGGILKSATISFGQNLVPADLDRAEMAVEACDLLLAVGRRPSASIRPPGWSRWPPNVGRPSSSSTGNRPHSTTWRRPCCGHRSATSCPPSPPGDHRMILSSADQTPGRMNLDLPAHRGSSTSHRSRDAPQPIAVEAPVQPGSAQMCRCRQSTGRCEATSKNN